jgi:hypothetical protein
MIALSWIPLLIFGSAGLLVANQFDLISLGGHATLRPLQECVVGLDGRTATTIERNVKPQNMSVGLYKVWIENYGIGMDNVMSNGQIYYGVLTFVYAQDVPSFTYVGTDLPDMLHYNAGDSIAGVYSLIGDYTGTITIYRC